MISLQCLPVLLQSLHHKTQTNKPQESHKEATTVTITLIQVQNSNRVVGDVRKQDGVVLVQVHACELAGELALGETAILQSKFLFLASQVLKTQTVSSYAAT